jgi:hypothetical protein
MPSRERLRQDLIRAGLDEDRFQGGVQ